MEEYSSDDDLGIEDDDEFRKKKAVHDKKKRQAEKVRRWYLCRLCGRVRVGVVYQVRPAVGAEQLRCLL